MFKKAKIIKLKQMIIPKFLKKTATAYFNEELTDDEYVYCDRANSRSGIAISQFYPAANSTLGGRSKHQQLLGLPSKFTPPPELPHLNTSTETPSFPIPKPPKTKYVPISNKAVIAVCIGIAGIVVGLLGLLAYCMIQIPKVRHSLGPWYVYPIEPCQIVETNSTTDLDKDEALRANFTIRYRQDCGLPFGFLYGLEIASVVTTTVLGILVNSLLVHGTLHHSDTFLLPWLIFHVPLIIGLFCAFVCIIILLDPIVYRAFGVIPMVFGVYLLWCWIKIQELYVQIRRKGILQRNFVNQNFIHAYNTSPPPRSHNVHFQGHQLNELGF